MAVSSVKRAAGSDPRPEAVQPPFQGLGGLGEECAGNTRGISVCLKAINPMKSIEEEYHDAFHDVLTAAIEMKNYKLIIVPDRSDRLGYDDDDDDATESAFCFLNNKLEIEFARKKLELSKIKTIQQQIAKTLCPNLISFKKVFIPRIMTEFIAFYNLPGIIINCYQPGNYDNYYCEHAQTAVAIRLYMAHDCN
jgi:hypothetical protein